MILCEISKSRGTRDRRFLWRSLSPIQNVPLVRPEPLSLRTYRRRGWSRLLLRSEIELSYHYQHNPTPTLREGWSSKWVLESPYQTRIATSLQDPTTMHSDIVVILNKNQMLRNYITSYSIVDFCV